MSERGRERAISGLRADARKRARYILENGCAVARVGVLGNRDRDRGKVAQWSREQLEEGEAHAKDIRDHGCGEREGLLVSCLCNDWTLSIYR